MKFVPTILLHILLFDIGSVFASRILMASPQLPSHVLEQMAMGRVLLEAGHEVHLVLESGFDPKLVNQIRESGFRIIHFYKPPDEERLSSDEYKTNLGYRIFNGSVGFIKQIRDIGNSIGKDCKFMMSDVTFLKTVGNIRFDLAIIEPAIPNMCCLILPKYFNLSFVSLTNTYLALDVRSPGLPSFYPRHYSNFDQGAKTSFPARFSQFLAILFFTTNFMATFSEDVSLLRQFAPEYSDWKELLRESMVFFYENDHHFNAFFPTLPNHISLAGLTCRPAKRLPENILEFLNGRIVNGVEPGLILLTFGSSADYIPKNTLVKFLKVFSKLNETLIAKFVIRDEEKELKSLVPPNVLVSNWLPQNDILGYPATQLFITHCGNNGQHEALYHGVPMLGFPLFAEQSINCRRMGALGFGLEMEILHFSEDQLLENILEILRNPKYKQAIQHMSNVFKDQPMTAQQRALFWVEHVIKHGGSHLRSSAMDLPLYQFLCFDTVGMLLMLLAIVVMVVYKILKMVTVKFYKWVKSRGSLEKKKQK